MPTASNLLDKILEWAGKYGTVGTTAYLETLREKYFGETRFKMVIAARADLGMSAGKLAAQVAHAAVRCAAKVQKEEIDEWNATGHTKIVVRVDSLAELEWVANAVRGTGLMSAGIVDEGRTEIPPNTRTAFAIFGPSDKVDEVTGGLDLY